MKGEDLKRKIDKRHINSGNSTLIDAHNREESTFPINSTIQKTFEKVARQIPDEIAVVFPDLTDEGGSCTSLTYADLNERADLLSEQLVKSGVQSNQFVAVFMERSIEMIVAFLGILKAGAAYVPLDPAYPMEQLSFMFEDTSSSVLITQSDLIKLFPPHDAHIIAMDSGWGAEHGRPDGFKKFADSIESELAYVNYTSGSTGTPKGVVVKHRGVLRLVINPNYATLNDSCNTLQLAPVTFDAATFEIWGALLNGGSCVLFPYHGIPDPKDLEKVMKTHGVTTLWLTASLFNAIIDIYPDALSGVKQLLTGGEALSVGHIRKAQKLLPDTQLINGYGPTESTTFTCCYQIPENFDENLTSIPIGYPINYTTVYVLDENMRACENGEPGELYIGGDGLAAGYLNRPEITAEKFIQDPFDEDGRLYKSGDLVRYLPDGEIEFIGRLDDQIKISGFRVELGEIESVLKLHDAVREALVLVFEDSAGSKFLTGYVTIKSGRTTDEQELTEYLKDKLPEFMIPRELMILQRLPLKPNGKIDRNALPKPGSNRSDQSINYVEARTETEKALVEIWCHPLKGLSREKTPPRSKKSTF